MNHKSLLIIAFVSLMLQGCMLCSRSSPDFMVPLDFGEDNTGEFEVHTDMMAEMVDNIASPIEIASLVKSLEIPFSQRYLANTRNVSRYHTSQEKAFNLGVFGCNLGYLNMYGRVSLVLDYISAVKNLADGIHVGQFFDFSTLKRIATNNQNIDSLVHISQQSFVRIERHLQQNSRGDLVTLMMSGVWVEGLYLTCQFLKERPHERRLAESICEQKEMLDRLLLMLNNYNRDRYISELMEELNSLKVLFNRIRILVEKGETQSVVVNGMLTFTSGDVSTIEYTDELMEEIIAQTEIVRNKLINK